MIVHGLFAAAVLAAAGQEAAALVPARLVSGSVVPVPIVMLGSGEVLLEVTIDLDGRVAGIAPLRTAVAMTAPVSAAVRGWRFDAAYRRLDSETATIRSSVSNTRISKVLVAAVFRPPALAGPTFGSAPVTTHAPDEETPFPIAVTTPAFPMSAFCAGVVLVEMRVEPDGSVSRTAVIESSPPFDGAALEAAKQWRFRPARVDGVAVASYAYVLFGFPLPITNVAGR
jgi:TonB family protein